MYVFFDVGIRNAVSLHIKMDLLEILNLPSTGLSLKLDDRISRFMSETSNVSTTSWFVEPTHEYSVDPGEKTNLVLTGVIFVTLY